MPYIKDEKLKGAVKNLMVASAEIIKNAASLSGGDDTIDGAANYAITEFLISLFGVRGYVKTGDALKALECAKLEWYRRAMAPWEDKKIVENGDIYPKTY